MKVNNIDQNVNFSRQAVSQSVGVCLSVQTEASSRFLIQKVVSSVRWSDRQLQWWPSAGMYTINQNNVALFLYIIILRAGGSTAFTRLFHKSCTNVLQDYTFYILTKPFLKPALEMIIEGGKGKTLSLKDTWYTWSKI